MAISTEIVGKEFGPFVREYTFKDLEICALGCNAGYDGKTDLEYVNEGDAANPDLKVLPIFGVPLTVHEEMTRTLDYGYDYDGSLHYGFEIKLHAPFKMNDRIETFVTQDALYDRGEGPRVPVEADRTLLLLRRHASVRDRDLGRVHLRRRLGRPQAPEGHRGDARSCA